MAHKNSLWRGLLALLILFPPATRAETPLAVLLSCRGDVTILKKSGATVKGSFGLQLHGGDEVRTGKGAAAEILFENGNSVEIGAGSNMQVKSARADKRPSGASVAGGPVGEKNFETVQNFLKLKDTGGTSSLAGLRSSDKASGLRAESPCQTKVRGNRPTFRWSASDPSVELRLTVYNEEGIHWKREVRDQVSLPYPPDAPSLVPGVAFSWTLETTDPLRFPPLRSQAAFFEILSPDEEKSLDATLEQIDRDTKKGGFTYHVVRASVFFDHSLMENAIEETKKAMKIDSENPALHSILARLFAEVGRTEEAIGEYDRLLEKR